MEGGFSEVGRAFANDMTPDVGFLVAVEAGTAQEQPAQHDRPFADTDAGRRDSITVSAAEQVLTADVEELVGDLHAERAAEGE